MSGRTRDGFDRARDRSRNRSRDRGRGHRSRSRGRTRSPDQVSKKHKAESRAPHTATSNATRTVVFVVQYFPSSWETAPRSYLLPNVHSAIEGTDFFNLLACAVGVASASIESFFVRMSDQYVRVVKSMPNFSAWVTKQENGTILFLDARRGDQEFLIIPTVSTVPGQLYLQKSGLETSLLKDLGGNKLCWNEQASITLSAHLVTLLEFDELREAFSLVERRAGGLRTPLLVVSVCGEAISLHRLLDLRSYWTHLERCLDCDAAFATRWRAWVPNHFISAHVLDESAVLSTIQEQPH
jgi:hypothetical protein